MTNSVARPKGPSGGSVRDPGRRWRLRRSLRPLLTGTGTFDADRLLGWHYPHKWGPEGPGLDPFTAIRADDWKLIYFYKDRRWELYDLARDLGETTDLAWRRADVADSLAGRLIEWMRAVDARPPHDRATDTPVAMPARP